MIRLYFQTKPLWYLLNEYYSIKMWYYFWSLV
nr:MAG TPA: hypothetical protein [Caudoviricetes sp.]